MPGSLIPQGSLVPNARPKKRGPSLLGVMLSAFLLLLLGVGGYIGVRLYWIAPQQYAKQEQHLFDTMPNNVRTALFLSEGERGTKYYTIQGSGYNEHTLEGTLVSVDARNADAKIVKTSGGTYTVSADSRVLMTSTVRKAGVARSIDGRYVAFAHASTTYTSEAAVDPATWVVTVYDTVSGTSREVGAGVSPLFVDALHLERITANGIVEYDMASGTERVLVSAAFATGGVQVLASPNRALLGWIDGQTRTIQIYKVFGEGVGLVATVPIEEGASSYGLGDDAIYMLKVARGVTTVWQQRFTGPALKVLTIPPSVGATRLVVGSL